MSATSNPPLLARGACMECRRLKTKCDRAIPCAPCKRRGCENICPSGLRARGSRNPSVEVEQLNRNIQSMTTRIRQLEEALRAAQMQVSGTNSPSPPPGFLTLHSNHYTPELSAVTQRQPQTPEKVRVQRDQILGMMPGETVAWDLLDKYYDSYGWLVQPISKPDLVNILRRVYSVPCTASNSEISALLAIFALGASNAQGPWRSSAWLYDLSIGVLRLDDVLAETDLSTVEAMTLQGAYLYLASDSENMRRAWNYVGIATRMAYGMELRELDIIQRFLADLLYGYADLDPKDTGLDREEAAKRRRAFHELVTLDVWQSMIIQRPPSCQHSLFSTEMPFDTLESLGTGPAFFQWKHAFIHQAVVPIINEVSCAITPPPYSVILEMDKRIRAFPVPLTLKSVDFKTAPMETLLQSQQIMLMTELTLIKLHKGQFLKSIEETAEGPLSSYSAPSINAVVGCSSSLLKRLRTIYVDCERIIPRLNCFWESAVAALSYLSLYIQRFMNGSTVKQLYIEFEMGCKLVADHTNDTPRVSKLISHVIGLRKSVHEAAPHLAEELRSILSERKKQDAIVAAPAPDLSLEYPLGASLALNGVSGAYSSTVDNATLSNMVVPSNTSASSTYIGSTPSNDIYGPDHFDPYLSLSTADLGFSGLDLLSREPGNQGLSFTFDRVQTISDASSFTQGDHYMLSFLQ